ncbi:response regulator [Paenibacillus alginolyticus]|uniref:Response regulator n=1 Tax=Paenibacillus alginolyticus TaxID=59839 RepID=A0ABT4GET4_9BACL|nr:response regulator [Paenibacillus alginolyticus]MCY9694671.1 response regulator [Paenibacillus alginolyticus]MEC0148011.1 response regulator [Paenibacillus alginolyticus]
MYKLVIVDDEPTVRFGLSTYFDWNAYGIEVVGDADDGDVALELIERVKPDLVLTDVRMPNMDGIQMSNRLSERFPHIKIVFVSGHDDAEYLKSALLVKAVDYMFKPVNLGELSVVVDRLVRALQTEKQERKLIEDMQVKLIQSMPLLREKFLMSLIREGITFPARIQDRIEFLGLNLPLDATYWVIAIRIDDASEIAQNRSERDQQLLSYSVLNIVQELIEKEIGGYVFENQIGEFVGILRLVEQEDQENLLFTLAEEVRESLYSYLKISVTIGVGERISSLASLPQSYSQAREAADQRWYLGKNQVISMDNLEQGNDSMYRFDPAQNERLISSLKAAEAGKVQEELHMIYSALSRNRAEGMPYGRNLSLQLLLLAGRIMIELNVHRQGLEEKENELLAEVFQQETLGDLRRLVESHLIEVCERIGEKRSGKAKNVIERIRSLIDKRFAENLQVGDIAKEVYLSTTYLCLLFKQETGETINEYMTKVRVDKAKELLKDPANKFYEVCYAVGYSDPSYFSKIFKKHTGHTPSSFRDHFM